MATLSCSSLPAARNHSPFSSPSPHRRLVPFAVRSNHVPRSPSPRIASIGAGRSTSVRSPALYRNSECMSAENLDDWVRDSVVEIVKNLPRSPLFVHVYSTADGGGGAIRLKTDAIAGAEEWPALTNRWKRGEIPSPDGIILVEELHDRAAIAEHVRDPGEDGEWESAKAWGIVIQGKGMKIGPTCYILKTSAVRSCSGILCTHFCLVRVSSFRETTRSLLTDCWLLR